VPHKGCGSSIVTPRRERCSFSSDRTWLTSVLLAMALISGSFPIASLVCAKRPQHRTIQGYEAMNIIQKGRARWLRGSVLRRQNRFINDLFEVSA
jgi:hypothetical protein